MIMDIVNVGPVGHCDRNASNEQKALYAEILTLRAKVASAEVLVDALKNSIQFISGSVRIESNSFDDPPSPVSEWDYQADMLALELNEALESYKKLS